MNSQHIPELSTDKRLDVDELSARCLGRLDLVDKILGRFHQAMDEELQQLELALHATDLPTVARIAHRIKGTALTVAAHRLKNCAERLEAAVHTDCREGIEASVAIMSTEWSRLSELLSAGSLRASE